MAMEYLQPAYGEARCRSGQAKLVMLLCRANLSTTLGCSFARQRWKMSLVSLDAAGSCGSRVLTCLARHEVVVNGVAGSLLCRLWAHWTSVCGVPWAGCRGLDAGRHELQDVEAMGECIGRSDAVTQWCSTSGARGHELRQRPIHTALCCQRELQGRHCGGLQCWHAGPDFRLHCAKRKRGPTVRTDGWHLQRAWRFACIVRSLYCFAAHGCAARGTSMLSACLCSQSYVIACNAVVLCWMSVRILLRVVCWITVKDCLQAQQKQFDCRDACCTPRDVLLLRADITRLPFATSSLAAIHAGAAIHCWPNPTIAVRVRV